MSESVLGRRRSARGGHSIPSSPTTQQKSAALHDTGKQD